MESRDKSTQLNQLIFDRYKANSMEKGLWFHQMVLEQLDTKLERKLDTYQKLAQNGSCTKYIIHNYKNSRRKQ